jgi:hypothetical protein
VIYTIGASAFPGWSALRYTALTTALGVPTIWAVNLALGVLGYNALPSYAALVSIGPQLAYMILIAGVVAVLAWNSGNKILTPINGVLFMDIVPLTTMVISAVQGYVFNQAEFLGAGLTITALILNNVYQRLASGKLWAASARGAKVQPVAAGTTVLEVGASSETRQVDRCQSRLDVGRMPA